MFKTISLFLVLALVIGALLVVAFWDDITAPRLDTATKQLISEACAEQGIGNLNWKAKDRQPNSVRYYGHYEGYEVFHHWPENVDRTRSGGYQFVQGIDFCYAYAGCVIYAYKDGKVSKLADISWSEDSLKAIRKQHGRYKNGIDNSTARVLPA